MATSNYYHINDSKLNHIVVLVRRDLPGLTAAEITDYMLADWPEGEDHQGWLNHGIDTDIADWVVAGRS